MSRTTGDDVATTRLARRLERLGTETAFAVSAEAAKYVQRGKRVYPFHLGDMNIQTPENIIAATEKALRDGKTGYCPNAGIPRLRELIAEDVNRTHGTHYAMENVVVQPGGKPTIGKWLLTMMNPGDEVLYPNPGYPIYESQIEFNGGVAVPYTYSEGAENFRLNLADIAARITPKTRLLIVNDLHNPTGAEATEEELKGLADLAIEHDLFVLCDEAYFDIRYEGVSTSLASFEGMESRCLVLYTFSKKFAMTGWRLGASIGPKPVVDAIAKINVNDESCSNHFIQYGAIEALTGDLSGHKAILETLRERRDRMVVLLNDIDGVVCYRPDATFYLFPNVTEVLRRKGIDDYEVFRRTVLDETGVSFCTRLHFGKMLPGETEKYIRFAYSGIDVADIEEGMAALRQWIEA